MMTSRQHRRVLQNLKETDADIEWYKDRTGTSGADTDALVLQKEILVQRAAVTENLRACLSSSRFSLVPYLRLRRHLRRLNRLVPNAGQTGNTSRHSA